MHLGYALVTTAWLILVVFIHFMNIELNDSNRLLVHGLKEMSEAGLAAFIGLWILSTQALREHKSEVAENQ